MALESALTERLAALRLTLHEAEAQVRPSSEGIPFLGFVVYPTHRLLLRRKGIYYRRKLRCLLAAYRRKEIERSAVGESLKGWINHVRYANTWKLRVALLKEVRL